MKWFKPWLPAAVLVVAGCATQAQFLDSKQSMAIDTALKRARFEMNCPDATATVLSREVIQPAYAGPEVMGVERAEFTIGIAGCDKRSTVVVVCPEGGEGCLAGEGSDTPGQR